jgi:hypothetical protein
MGLEGGEEESLAALLQLLVVPELGSGAREE